MRRCLDARGRVESYLDLGDLEGEVLGDPFQGIVPHGEEAVCLSSGGADRKVPGESELSLLETCHKPSHPAQR